jgi:hypothetical protein
VDAMQDPIYKIGFQISRTDKIFSFNILTANIRQNAHCFPSDVAFCPHVSSVEYICHNSLETICILLLSFFKI